MKLREVVVLNNDLARRLQSVGVTIVVRGLTKQNPDEWFLPKKDTAWSFNFGEGSYGAPKDELNGLIGALFDLPE